MLEKEQETSAVDHGEEAHVWQEKLSEIGRKRANFQELAAEGFMTKEELRSKLDTLELAREAAERELRLARERSERLSTLEQDAEHHLERCAMQLNPCGSLRHGKACRASRALSELCFKVSIVGVGQLH